MQKKILIFPILRLQYGVVLLVDMQNQICQMMLNTLEYQFISDYITGSAYKYQMFEKGTAKTHWQAYFNSYKSSENQVLFDKVIDTLGDSITEQRTWQVAMWLMLYILG